MVAHCTCTVATSGDGGAPSISSSLVTLSFTEATVGPAIATSSDANCHVALRKRRSTINFSNFWLSDAPTLLPRAWPACAANPSALVSQTQSLQDGLVTITQYITRADTGNPNLFITPQKGSNNLGLLPTRWHSYPLTASNTRVPHYKALSLSRTLYSSLCICSHFSLQECVMCE